MIFNHRLTSKFLSEPRGITCFRSQLSQVPQILVVCFDGQAVAAFEPGLTRLGTSLLPMMVVGVHSVAELRSKEYLRGNQPTLYQAHERFVLEELLPWIQWQFGVVANREHTALAGFSNGATLALTLGLSF